MSPQNLRYNNLPSIFLRPIPMRHKLSREERVEVHGRLLRARAKINEHQRTMQLLKLWGPVFKMASKRERARAKVMQQVRQQRKKLPLSVWQVAIQQAIDQKEGCEAASWSLPPGEEDDSDGDDYSAYTPRSGRLLSSSPSSESDSNEEDLEDTKDQDRAHLKLEKRTKKDQDRDERKIRRAAIKEQRLERRFLRSVNTKDSDSNDEEMAKFVKEHEETSRALDAARKLKLKVASSPLRRIQPTLLSPAKSSPSKRIKPTLVQSIELPSDDSEDEDYVEDESMGGDEELSDDDGFGEYALALKARIGEVVESESGSDSNSDSDSASDSDSDNEAMDEDEVDEEGLGEVSKSEKAGDESVVDTTLEKTQTVDA